MYKYLVMRKEGLRLGRINSSLNSSYFPVMVESEFNELLPENVVKRAFEERGWGSYEGRGHTYLVFRVVESVEVSFVPKKDYDVFVNPF